MSIKGYRDLLVWHKAADIAVEVYKITRRFPSHERFGLSSQLQRAAVSVASNIAEGQARWHMAEFRQFLYHALGSLAEVDTQLYLAQEFGYVAPWTFHARNRLSKRFGRWSTLCRLAFLERRGVDDDPD